MKVISNANQISIKGAAETFSGNVRIDNYFNPGGSSRMGAAIVTFEPGARTAWHAHVVGQLLYITHGVGWVQKEGEAKQVIAAGDTVWIEAGRRLCR